MVLNSTIVRGWAPALVWVVLVVPSCGLVAAADFTVDSTADYFDVSQGDGSCEDSTGHCTLRAAIEEANALAGDDTVTLPAGTYPIGTQLTVDTTISISGAGEAVTILDGGLAGRVFLVQHGGHLSADNLTVQNGALNDSGGNIQVLLAGSYLYLYQCTVKGGSAVNGGGIDVIGGTASLAQTTVSGNHATRGGGIHASSGAVFLSLCDLTNNTADSRGGGLSAEDLSLDAPSTVSIGFSTISGNSAGDRGGGLELEGGALELTDSIVSSNSATGSGGGLAVDQYSNVGNNHEFLIERTALISNTTQASGGGLAVLGGSRERVDVANTTFSGNSADQDGGGIYWAHGLRVSLSNCTVSDNTADADGTAQPGDGNGGGVYAFNNGTEGGVILRNTVVAGNHDSSSGLFALSAPDCAVRDSSVVYITSEGHNFVGFANDLCAFSGPRTGDEVGWYAAIDPGLGTLTNSGYYTWFHPPLEGSRLIDRGNPAACTDEAGVVLGMDQRGEARPWGTTRCDIGSVESSLSGLYIFTDDFESGDSSYWSTVQ